MFWVKRFFVDFLGSYVDGLRAARGLFWFVSALVLWEFAQHVVEIRTGFFDTAAARSGAAFDPGRMLLGWIKMISIYIGYYLVFRYLHWGSARRAFAPDLSSIARFFPYFAYSLIMFALIFYAPLFIPDHSVAAFRSVAGLSQLAIEPLLIPWIVSAATGGTVRGPLGSGRQMGWLYFWALLLGFVGRIPLNGGHRLLNMVALGQPGAVLWSILALDSLVVGLILVVIPALYFRIARAAADHAVRVSERTASSASAAAGA